MLFIGHLAAGLVILEFGIVLVSFDHHAVSIERSDNFVPKSPVKAMNLGRMVLGTGVSVRF